MVGSWCGVAVVGPKTKPFHPAEWMEYAACKGEDPDIFFPVQADKDGVSDAAAPAKRICAACPVREACLEYAMRYRERYGVWGGTSASQRSRMRRRQRWSSSSASPSPSPQQLPGAS